jgi:ribonuclease HII
MSHKRLFVIGVDEAGRGPLAGPVAVGAVSVPADFDWGLLDGVTDSKKLSPEKREMIFNRARVLKKRGTIRYRVSLVNARMIDREGITSAVRLGIMRSLSALEIDPKDARVKLDGLLYAPPRYTFQETIIRGDESELVIGLASILAKVTRDRYMMRTARKYPAYSFDRHKGYGTRAHKLAIHTHGLCVLHRRSFCKFAQAAYSL